MRNRFSSQTLLPYLTVAAIGMLMAAAPLFWLLHRLGDESGAHWAGWLATVSAGVALISIALITLLPLSERPLVPMATADLPESSS